LLEADQKAADMIKTENRELGAERLERVRQILKQRGIVRVDELCAELGVSPATVRRDLVELDMRGHLRRVHGGAVCAEGRLEEPVFDDKTGIAAREKQEIAEAAVELIEPNDSVFLDGGSTVLALARLVCDMNGLTVVTNSLRVAGVLAGSGPRVILIGGELRRLSQTFVGALTCPLLGQLSFDKAFMGTIGLSQGEGLTTTDPREAETKGLVIARARRVVLLADSSKIGKVSFVNFGGLVDIDVLITDSGAGGKDLGELRKAGVDVRVASVRVEKGE
jgi:DeoR family fructose operon transcriptional repressor